MLVSELDYELPPERIAQRPLAERDASRLLLLDRSSGAFADRQFRGLPGLLRGDEVFVVNEARVLPARLLGRRRGVRAQPIGRRNRAWHEFLTAESEVFLLRRIEGDTWEALVRPGRKLRIGERIVFGEDELEAEILGRGAFGLRRVRLVSADGDADAAVERLGHMPLPPYIKRADEPADRERYQTIFARRPGAVAAPTAGLHFSPRTLDQIRARAVPIVSIRLDVGLGTFAPVRTERFEDHPMHSESYEISPEAAEDLARARREGRRILAVGTTVVRALEDAAAKAAARGMPAISPGRAEADLYLLPGHRFRLVDQLLTNFHLPRSTLLALVAAFAGRETLLAAYRHAVLAGYRFYSYGDAMLIR